MATGHAPTFGDMLRRYRIDAGLTQEELAEKAGLSAKGISDLERDARQHPRRDTVRLLADALKLGERDRAILEAVARHRRAFGGAAADQNQGLARAHFGSVVPLVGRTHEVQQLETQLLGEAAPLLLLAGEPGIGKSRLLHEACIRAPVHGWTVLAGGCHRRSGQEPFEPFLDVLVRHLARQPAAERRLYLRGCSWLVRLLPELAETLTPPEYALGLSPEQERRLMFTAVARYLANVSGPAGTLLVLDDLQWAGQDALDLLSYLLRTTDGEPQLRMIAAYRDTETRTEDALGVVATDLAREGLAARMTVAPLAPPSAMELLERLLAEAPAEGVALHRERRQHVVQRMGGVPFFLVSYVQGLGSGALSMSDPTGLPWSAAETIRQRVAALPPVARDVLEIAAVCGRDAPHSLLIAVARLARHDEREALSGLEHACRARLLVEASAAAYAFSHELVREAVMAEIGVARRATLHRQIAQALEQGSGVAAIESLAYHYGQTGELEKAAHYLEQAGDRARDRFANAEAQDYYRMALAPLDDLGRAEDAARVRERLAVLHVILSQYDQALMVLERAADTFRVAHDLEGLARVAAQLGQVHALRGTPQEGIARVEPLLARAATNGISPRGIAALSAALARLFLVRGQYSEQLAAAQQAAEYARLTADLGTLVEAEYFRGWALLQLGRCADGLRTLESVVPMAETTEDLRFLAIARTNAAWGYGLMGEFEAARRHLAAARRAAERFGDPTVLALAMSVQSDLAYRYGDWEQAWADGERAVELLRQVASAWRSMWPPFCLGQLALARKELETALAYYHEALSVAQSYGDPHLVRRVQVTLAERDLLDGHPDQALERLLPLLDRSAHHETLVTVLLPILAWAHLDTGDGEQAAVVIDEALARAREDGLRVPLVDALRVHGMIYARQERWQAAAAALEEAIGLARDMPYPYAEGKSLYTYGHLYMAQGDSMSAREQLEAALVLLNRLGERLYAEHVERALRTMAAEEPGTDTSARST